MLMSCQSCLQVNYYLHYIIALHLFILGFHLISHKPPSHIQNCWKAMGTYDFRFVSIDGMKSIEQWTMLCLSQ
ncbi:hypothetical protein L6452_20486 [Arctium lappa]|uniref:Uncharacterized protein n=1 Tax=Arctium lappa TaxID=4217 RepID=A0ACB9BB23_ARCLA|nr:hypothetical protein L6452_20486 [Arctium lappa]